jgi:hypothetical protein
MRVAGQSIYYLKTTYLKLLIQLTLYSTAHCHLCDLAHSLLLNFDDKITLKIIDIAEDETLLDKFSLRIPVLQRQDTQAELNWPFTSADIHKFLA